MEKIEGYLIALKHMSKLASGQYYSVAIDIIAILVTTAAAFFTWRAATSAASAAAKSADATSQGNEFNRRFSFLSSRKEAFQKLQTASAKQTADNTDMFKEVMEFRKRALGMAKDYTPVMTAPVLADLMNKPFDLRAAYLEGMKGASESGRIISESLSAATTIDDIFTIYQRIQHYEAQHEFAMIIYRSALAKMDTEFSLIEGKFAARMARPG